MVSKFLANLSKVLSEALMEELAILSYHTSAKEVPHPLFILLRVVIILSLLAEYSVGLMVK